MERMTEWDETNNRWYIVDSVGKWDVKDAVDRLAAYEDLGLTPEEITAQLNTYSYLLCEITNNRLSKTNYALDDILTAYNDVQSEECEQCHVAQQSAMRGRLRHILQSIYTVTVVDYIDGKAQRPIVFLFDNPMSAAKCQRILSNDKNIVSITKETVHSTFLEDKHEDSF